MCVTRVTVTRFTRCPPTATTLLGHLSKIIHICYAFTVFSNEFTADNISINQLNIDKTFYFQSNVYNDAKIIIFTMINAKCSIT